MTVAADRGLDEFWRGLAHVRARVSRGAIEGLAPDLDELDRIAPSRHERARVAPVRIAAGAIGSDEALLASGLEGLSGMTPDLLVDALAAVPDLAMLGLPSSRARYVDSPLQMVLGEEDVALSFVHDPGPGTAGELKAGSWSLPADLDAPLAIEVLTRLAWSALGAYRDYRQQDYLDVLALPLLDGDHPEGLWEVQLCRALALVVQDRIEDADRAIKLLLRRAGAPPWRESRVREAKVLFAPFAGPAVESWMRGVTDEEIARAKAEPLGRAGVGFAKVAPERSKGCAAGVTSVTPELRGTPWLSFLFLIGVRNGPWSTDLADTLLNDLKRTGDAAALPWSIERMKRFVVVLEELEDQGVALALAQRVLADKAEPAIRNAALAVLATAPGTALARLVDSDMVQMFSTEELSRLPAGRRMLLSRRGTYRAVVDGSNVMYGGRSGSAGAKPRVAHLDEVLDQLRAAGFEEIDVYVDSRTLYALTDGERRDVDGRYARSELSVVRYADPEIIQRFLESPATSVVVTNDRYRQDAPRFPAFASWMPRRQYEIFIDPSGRARIARNLGEQL